MLLGARVRVHWNKLIIVVPDMHLMRFDEGYIFRSRQLISNQSWIVRFAYQLKHRRVGWESDSDQIGIPMTCGLRTPRYFGKMMTIHRIVSDPSTRNGIVALSVAKAIHHLR
jgi:hypothetical protein